ncbi:hypothetical protein MHAS44199_02170 [Mycolicibacterium hassiacum DSM 44199]|nr:hypothetical protein [Mycolicibacterium hassiacum DSM 44199]
MITGRGIDGLVAEWLGMLITHWVELCSAGSLMLVRGGCAFSRGYRWLLTIW